MRNSVWASSACPGKVTMSSKSQFLCGSSYVTRPSVSLRIFLRHQTVSLSADLPTSPERQFLCGSSYVTRTSVSLWIFLRHQNVSFSADLPTSPERPSLCGSSYVTRTSVSLRIFLQLPQLSFLPRQSFVATSILLSQQKTCFVATNTC